MTSRSALLSTPESRTATVTRCVEAGLPDAPAIPGSRRCRSRGRHVPLHRTVDRDANDRRFFKSCFRSLSSIQAATDGMWKYPSSAGAGDRQVVRALLRLLESPAALPLDALCDASAANSTITRIFCPLLASLSGRIDHFLFQNLHRRLRRAPMMPGCMPAQKNRQAAVIRVMTAN